MHSCLHATYSWRNGEFTGGQARPGTPRSGAPAAGRPRGVRGARQRSIRNLLVRTTQGGGARRNTIEQIPREPDGVGVLSGAGPILPEGGGLVGHHRESGADETQTPRATD